MGPGGFFLSWPDVCYKMSRSRRGWIVDRWWRRTRRSERCLRWWCGIYIYDVVLSNVARLFRWLWLHHQNTPAAIVDEWRDCFLFYSCRWNHRCESFDRIPSRVDQTPFHEGVRVGTQYQDDGWCRPQSSQPEGWLESNPLHDHGTTYCLVAGCCSSGTSFGSRWGLFLWSHGWTMSWRFHRSGVRRCHRGDEPPLGRPSSWREWQLGWFGPRVRCVLMGGNFATSRKCQLRRGPRWLDQEPLRCYWKYHRQIHGSAGDLCGISAQQDQIRTVE